MIVKSEDCIKCPNCESEYEIVSGDLFDFEGKELECAACGKTFKISDMYNTTHITTRLKEC